MLGNGITHGEVFLCPEGQDESALLFNPFLVERSSCALKGRMRVLFCLNGPGEWFFNLSPLVNPKFSFLLFVAERRCACKGFE